MFGLKEMLDQIDLLAAKMVSRIYDKDTWIIIKNASKSLCKDLHLLSYKSSNNVLNIFVQF